MRISSLICYREIKENGLLSVARMMVFEALASQDGPATAGDLAIKEPMLEGMDRNNISARLGELVLRGVVREMPELRKDGRTGHQAIVYDIVDAMPHEPVGPAKETKGQLIHRLETENSNLSARVEQLIAQNLVLETAAEKRKDCIFCSTV